MITHLHHINFLVRDLALAVDKYRELLGHPNASHFIFDAIETRGVKTARTKIGATWLVLVQPIDQDGIPAKHLEKHGEGFFIMSLGCDNLDQELARIQSTTDLQLSSVPRQGLETWRVQDLNPEDFNSVQIQLTVEEVKQG